MDAIMYNKRVPLIKVSIEDGQIVTVEDIFNTNLLPIILQTEEGPPEIDKLNEWFKKRMIPENRDGLRQTMSLFPDFSRVRGNMLGLSDQYWFQFDPSESWDDLNYFTHIYDQTTGTAFFTPWVFEKDQKFPPSPDLTTNGALKKTWEQQADMTSHLIKAGNRRLHQEPITEVLASAILKKMNIIPFVSYKLRVKGMVMCSECANFIDENTEFVPASHIYFKKKRTDRETVYSHLIRMCDLYEIEGAQQYIDSMITADHIMGNDDRHLGNFGFIRDAETGRILRFAPLFDSGSAYGGKTNRVNKQRLFDPQKDEALRKNIEKINAGFFDHRELFDLITLYPDINKKQREFIKNRIITAEKEVEKELARMKARGLAPAFISR